MSNGIPSWKVYGAATTLAVTMLGGLLSALFGDGLWDAVSWVVLAIPLAVIVWKYNRVPRME